MPAAAVGLARRAALLSLQPPSRPARIRLFGGIHAAFPPKTAASRLLLSTLTAAVDRATHG